MDCSCRTCRQRNLRSDLLVIALAIVAVLAAVAAVKLLGMAA
jgi:hypothetical protein